MIQDNLPVTIYTADGTQTEWNIPYQFSNAAEIALYISHNDVLTPINAADYLVDVENATITYPVQAEGVEDPVTPVPQGDLVVIERANAITQEEDSTASLFKSPDVERIADKLTKICQELSYRLSRTISYNPTVPDAEIITDVSEFKADIQSDMDNAIAAHNSSNTAHTDIRSAISSHISNTANPHNITKAQVGLGNADNTADSDKPISTATQNALDLKQDNLTSSQLAAVNSGIDSEQVDQIGINTNAIASEIADREDADTLLQNQITALSNNKQDNLTSIQLEAVNSGINSTKVAAIATNTSDIADINAKIPSEASSTNKLADKTYVNDAVNSVAAYYVTANAQGESFATKAALVAGPWYYDGSLRTPTTNDYAFVVADETHDGISARYTYTGSQWAFQYIINTTTFTQDQLNAIDSGITATKVSSYDSHIINTSNPHSVTKSQVGLGNVDNTSDLSKPVSTATQSALNALDAAKASNADDSTIIDNGATISTIAVKEQRANAVIKKWVGTKSQYDAITTKDANTTYIVTDEDDSALFVIDSALSSTSTNAVQNKVIKTALDAKQATISDLADIRNGAELGYTAVQPSAISDMATKTWVGNQGYLTEHQDISGKADKTELAEVAFSGDYADLDNKPTKVSTFTNDAGYLTAHQDISGKQDVIIDLATIRTNAQNGANAATTIAGYGDVVTHDASEFLTEHQDISGKQNVITTTNKLSSDLIDDTNKTNKFVTSTEKSTWSGKQNAITSSNKLSADLLSEGTNNKLVSATEKSTWNRKQDALSATQISNIAKGGTAVQPTNVATTSSVGVVKVDGTSIIAAADGTISATSSGVPWGSVSGTLSDQTDLQNALNSKQDALSTAQIAATNSGITAAKVSSYDTHVADTDIHVTVSDKSTWNGKQSALSTAQLSATNSGVTSTKVSGYDSHITNNDIHVTAAQKTTWSGKQDALSSAQQNAVNSGVTAAKVSGYDTHIANSDIHVTTAQKTAWTGKQDAISDLATIRSGASAGATAVQPADLQTAINSVKRNIGEIVPSMIPLTDAGLHLLDGSVISGSGSYSAFVTYVAGLVSDYPGLFETEVNWQTSVTNYGVCGKFVYDSVNNTVRLPKVTGVIEGTTDVSALGDLVEAGLPNITGDFSASVRTDNWHTSGAFYPKTDTSTDMDVTTAAYQKGITAFNASRSSSIYGNSTTVQPQTIKVHYYIVIANTTKTEIQVDIDEVVSDLNGKADTDLSNVSATGKETASGWAMPLMDPNHWVSLTLGARSATYTMPEDGLVCFDTAGGTAGGYILLVCGNCWSLHCASQNYEVLRTFLFVPKGYVFAADYVNAGTLGAFGYYKLKGNAN